MVSEPRRRTPHGQALDGRMPPSPAQAVWALYLLVGSVPGPRLILMWLSEGQKTACTRWPFPMLASSGSGLLRELPSNVSWGDGYLTGAEICFREGSLQGERGGAGYWWGTSTPLRVYISMGTSLHSCWASAQGGWLPTERGVQETNMEASVVLGDLASEVTRCPFCSTLLPTEPSSA